MRQSFIFFVFASLIFTFTQSCKHKTRNEINYPVTVKVDSVDNYFGHQVADPYRWLEDDQSVETKAWVEAQNNVTNAFLQKIPFRDSIKSRLQKVWSYARQSAPMIKGDYHFFGSTTISVGKDLNLHKKTG